MAVGQLPAEHGGQPQQRGRAPRVAFGEEAREGYVQRAQTLLLQCAVEQGGEIGAHGDASSRCHASDVGCPRSSCSRKRASMLPWKLVEPMDSRFRGNDVLTGAGAS